MHSNQPSLPQSKHFSLKQIAVGIFAAFSSRGGGAVSNAGIIDLGDRTLIFDTFETPIAAEDLRVASEELTGLHPTWVINSHAHPDHWFGNQVFPDETIIITTQKTRNFMLEFIEEVDQEKADPSELENYLESQKERLTKEPDPRALAVIESSVARWGYYLESLPDLQLRLPNQTFDGNIVFHGSQRTVELNDVGPAHTGGDCYLTIPSVKIAFLGDLGFFQEQPYMPDSDPICWLSIIEKLGESPIDIFIPGHGPMGTKKDLDMMGVYIRMLEKMVTEAISQGESVDYVLNQQLPEPFRTWSIGGIRLEDNIRFLFDYLSRN